MAHPPLTELIDAARGILPESRRNAVDAHLRECDACAGVMRTWTAFGAFVQHDAGYEPPADAVRVVRSYFGAVHRADAAVGDRRTRIPALMATLVFDSFAAPAVGVRSAGASGSRHLLYEAPPLAIDLLIQEAARGLLLTGQISDSSAPDATARPAHVSLMRDSAELARLACNEFGEFHGECDGFEELSLVIAAPQHSVVIPLFRLCAGA